MRDLTAKVTVMALIFGIFCAVVPAFADESPVSNLENQVQSLNDKVAQLERSLRSVEEKAGQPTGPSVPVSGTAENKGGLLHLSQDVNMGGYVDLQWNNNFTQPATNGTRPAPGTAGGSSNRVRSYDKYDGSFTVNAAKLYLEKPVTEPKTAGFRVDLKFGEDPNFTNANGAPGTAGTVNLFDLEQAYVEYKAPLVDGSKILPDSVDIKVGRFFTLAGFEVVDAPYNWNISRSLMYTYAAPFTHDGIRTQTKWFDGKIDAYLGINNGWDRAIDNNSMKTIESGLGYKLFDSVSFFHAFYFGPETTNAASTPTTTEGSKTWVFTNNATWQITDKLALGGDYEVGENRGALNVGTIDTDASNNNAWWWGLAGYLKYKFTDKFSVASRSEMFHDASVVRTGLASAFFEQTLTADYNLTDNLITRAEFRWDRSDDRSIFGLGSGGTGERSSQTTIGGEVIYLI